MTAPFALKAFDRLRLPWPSVGPWCLGLLLGTALQLQQRALWPLHLYWAVLGVALVGAVLLLWLQRKGAFGRGGGLVLSGLLAAAMAFGGTGWRATVRAAQILSPAAESVDWAVSGVVVSLPQKGLDGWRFEFAPDTKTKGDPDRGPQPPIPALLWLGWYSPDQPVPELKVGDHWRFTVRLKRPHSLFNPGGFDGELWLWEQGYGATGTVRTGSNVASPLLLNPPPNRGAAAWTHPIESARQSVRSAIWQALPESRSAGVVVALVTGDQQAIDPKDWDLFRLTGVAHLMSISGLHITLLAWLGGRVIAWCWRRSERLMLLCPAVTAGRWGGWAVALAYSAFCGWGIPAQRTVLMLGVVTALQTSAKRWPSGLIWLSSAAVVVLWDPWALLQAGFWLSFLAVGVLFISGAGAPKSTAPSLGSGSGKAWLKHHGALLLREQGLMTLALAPLTWILFGQVSLVGLLANLIAIPWVTFVVTPLAFLGALWSPLWTLAALAVQGLLWLLDGLAAGPVGSWSVAAAPAWLDVLGLCGAVILVFPGPWRLRLLGLPWVLPMVLWQAPRPTWGEFELLVPDIGQGNAVILRTQTHTLLYDSGPRNNSESDAGQRVLVPLLKRTQEPLDRIMLSHRDSDHTGGAASVMAAYPQVSLWSSLEPEHPLLQEKRGEKEGDQQGRPRSFGSVLPCLAGQHWRWDGVDFEVLHPLLQDLALSRDPSAKSAKPAKPVKPIKTNALSCVLRISSGVGSVRRALLVGDIEMPQEQDLVIRDEAALKADFLLVPHHGSNTSSNQTFLRAVSPRWSFVQAGYRNRFGHPAPKVVSRYQNLGLEMVSSPQCGAATWASSAPNQLICEREVNHHYWNDWNDWNNWRDWNGGPLGSNNKLPVNPSPELKTDPAEADDDR